MVISRRANTVLFGFDFQVNAAIVLMLENIKNLKTLKLEGNHEDIELILENGNYILAQAKAVEKSSVDFKNVRKNLKKALASLSEGSRDINVEKLIFITNSPNPLNEDVSRSIFYGEAHREFYTLPDSSQKIIREFLEEITQPLDLEKFMIQILPFETDNDKERLKVVKTKVDDFIGEMDLDISGLGKKLLTIWHNDIFTNGTKKDASIKLRKSDVVWPIIVIAAERISFDEMIEEEFDSSVCDEIRRKYNYIIEANSERCEFFIKVLYDYNLYDAPNKPKEKILNFVRDRWKNYLSDFDIYFIDDEIKMGLIKVILYVILQNRFTIQKIKEGVNL